MLGYAPSQNVAGIARKAKGLIKLFGGLAAPFYWTDVVIPEGTLVQIDTSAQDKIKTMAGGDAAACIGMAMQCTYDDSAWGQLKGYHFANDTRAHLGQPIGVLTGTGYALTNTYVGSPTYGLQAYLNAAVSGGTGVSSGTAGAYVAADLGKLTSVSGASNAKLPVIFEGASPWTSADAARPLIRIRFNFGPCAPLVA